MNFITRTTPYQTVTEFVISTPSEEETELKPPTSPKGRKIFTVTETLSLLMFMVRTKTKSGSILIKFHTLKMLEFYKKHLRLKTILTSI